MEKTLYDFIVENNIFLENTEETNKRYSKLVNSAIKKVTKDTVHISRTDVNNSRNELTFQLSNDFHSRASQEELEKIANEFCRSIKLKTDIIREKNLITIFITDDEYINDKIILRGHGEKYEKTNENIEKQEKVQMFCIENNLTDKPEEILKKLLDKGLVKAEDDTANYVKAGINSAKAWNKWYNGNKKISCSYPSDEKETIASYITKKVYKNFEQKPSNINEWNPADIYIHTITLSEFTDAEEIWFKENPENIKNICKYNEFLNKMILDKKVFPVSLKMNTGKGNSVVHEINVKTKLQEDKKSHAELGQKIIRKSSNGYSPIITSQKGIVVNIVLDGLPYSYCFRSFGDTYSVEAKNGKMTDKEITDFKSKKIEEDADILVRNLTSSLGKAKATLSMVMTNLKKDSKELTDQIYVVEDEEQYPLLYQLTHLPELKVNKCKDKKIIALFNAWIKGMVNLVDEIGDESEALCYTKYAAEKRNYGKMFTFAPYIKIA